MSGTFTNPIWKAASFVKNNVTAFSIETKINIVYYSIGFKKI